MCSSIWAVTPGGVDFFQRGRREARLAMRVSNAVAIAMLFMAGYAFGSYSGVPSGKSGSGDGNTRHGDGRDHDRVRGMKATQQLAVIAVVVLLSHF
jgi:hypothetical protein